MGDAGVSKGDGQVTEECCKLEEGVDMGGCVAVFESTRDEVAVLLPVVADAVASVVSELTDVAVSKETNNDW